MNCPTSHKVAGSPLREWAGSGPEPCRLKTHPFSDIRWEGGTVKMRASVDFVCSPRNEPTMSLISVRSRRKSWLLLTVYVLFYVIYLLLGALVFSILERPVEDRLRVELQRLKQEFLVQSCVSDTELEEFLIKALTANKYGVSVLWHHSVHTNWDLASSMFFVNTLVTTLGYGHITPLSDMGKAFSILYALMGVPFTMLVLTACAHKLMYPLVYAPIGRLQKAGLEVGKAASIHFALVVLLVILLLFVAPALVFSSVEESWSFLDAIYFCVISLFTIGLGDYVPGAEPDRTYNTSYMVCVLVYLFTGLMMMYLLLRFCHKIADEHGLTTALRLPHCDKTTNGDRERSILSKEEETPSIQDSTLSTCATPPRWAGGVCATGPCRTRLTSSPTTNQLSRSARARLGHD